MQKDKAFNELIYTADEAFIRKIYHKLVIGLESVKVELLSQSDSLPQIEDAIHAVVSNVFPPDIQKDMKTSIKGRAVLILIEIAYQDLPNSNTSYIAKMMNIPVQTVNDEIKRLTNMNYLQLKISAITLIDTRKKNYALTHKGLVFLHLLKETLTATFIKMQKGKEYQGLDGEGN